MRDSFIFSSNSIKLSRRGWLVILAILSVIICLSPVLWQQLEEFEPLKDYRLPYILSDDYWMFKRWSKIACSKYPVLVLGDSVVWGQYVTMDQTLSHYLNKQAGEDIFANMGVDGTHPAAILGLVKYYGRAISNEGVVLHLNPLWMSSERHDLSGKEEFRFNHPRLIPQFIHKPSVYRPSLAQRISVLAERGMPFFCLTSHIRINYFENMNLQNWTIQYPYKNPLSAINLRIPTPENSPKSEPISWSERGIEKQDFSWVPIGESYQWDSFKRVIRALGKNNIFVIIGPFNPYILTEESLSRYNNMKREMERWFEEKGIDYKSLSDLPSEDYADASHPLKEGYAKIAKELFETESFRKWMESYMK